GVGEDHFAIAVLEQIGELSPLPVPVHRHGYSAQHPDTNARFDERDLVVEVNGDSVTGRDIKGGKAIRDCTGTGADSVVVAEDVSTSHAGHQSAILEARQVANMSANSLPCTAAAWAPASRTGARARAPSAASRSRRLVATSAAAGRVANVVARSSAVANASSASLCANPIRIACSASIGRPASSNSNAAPSPTSRGSNQLAPISGTRPM